MNKLNLICLVLGMTLTPVMATQYPVCTSQNIKVYIDRDLKFGNQITAKSKLLGSAVYETILTAQGKQFTARFDCRAEQSNISFDTKNYATVDPTSCAGAIYKTVCGI